MSTPIRDDYCASFSFDSEVMTHSSESPDSTTLEVDTASESGSCSVELDSIPMDIDTCVTLSPPLPASSAGPSSSGPLPASSAGPSSSGDTLPVQSVTVGFKAVFDNYDETVKPRHMRMESQSQSLHCVHAYGVVDRVNYSSLPSQRSGATNLYSLLPSPSDYTSLKDNFTVLISRVIVDNLTFFRDDFKRLVLRHIPHQYSAEHSKKSEVVSACVYWSMNNSARPAPLVLVVCAALHFALSLQVPIGVLIKNETKHTDMIGILEEYKKYVPSRVVVPEDTTSAETTGDTQYNNSYSAR